MVFRSLLYLPNKISKNISYLFVTCGSWTGPALARDCMVFLSNASPKLSVETDGDMFSQFSEFRELMFPADSVGSVSADLFDGLSVSPSSIGLEALRNEANELTRFDNPVICFVLP